MSNHDGDNPATRPSPGGSLEDLREQNLARVVAALRVGGRASRTDIARMTGISRTTASSVVTELRRAGLVREGSASTAPTRQGGRPPVLVELDPLAGLAVGIDFDHDRVHVAVSDLAHAILAERVVDLDVDGDGRRALDVASELVRDAVAQTGVRTERVIGVGMSIPAPVEHATGVVLETEILPGWASLNPSAEMAERLSLPVQSDNDANLGALGEATWGAGKGLRDFLFLQLRSGIGAGLLLRGQVYRGTAGLAGELGHVTVDEGGPLCSCGNRGCLQQVASEPAILDALRGAGRPQRSVAEVVEAAQAGDRVCLRVLDDAGRHVGRALAMACNLLNPQRVIVGGDLRRAGELLLGPARDALARHALAGTASSTDLVAGELGSAAEVHGALALVLLATDEHISARVVRGV